MGNVPSPLPGDIANWPNLRVVYRTEQPGDEDDGQHRGLAAFVAYTFHSTRSVVSDLRSPDATTNPSRSILYG